MFFRFLRTAISNRGNASKYIQRGLNLRAQGDLRAAELALHEAVNRFPRNAIAATNLGIVLLERNQGQQGAEMLLRALELDPGCGAAHFNLANLHRASGRFDEAVVHYGRAAEATPVIAPAREQLMLALAEVCNWDRAAAEADNLRALIREKPAADWLPAVSPLTAVYLHLDAETCKAVARHHAAEAASGVAALSRAAPKAEKHRLRIGYLSHDFRDHPVGHLMRGALELHDRRGFEVFAFSSGVDDGSVYRKAIETGADHFIDISDKSDREAANQIAARGIDVLIDLMGHTTGNRLGLLARRAAPLQAHYLGYAGTTGAPYLDYFISDRIASPPEAAGQFTEQLALLAGGFMISNGLDTGGNHHPTRAQQGLPEDAIVFCNFTNSSRITSEVFRAWAEILRAVPSSVLWLKQSHALTVENLRREAQRHDVNPARLVFARRVADKQAHLARVGLADLALDTIGWHNGHSNTSDMLWAGVPVLTTLGLTFASRVAASVLHAADLPELVARDIAHYVRLAVEIACDRERCAGLKKKLLGNQRAAPFFNQRSTVAGLEHLYQAMWRDHEAGRGARAIVSEGASHGEFTQRYEKIRLAPD